MALTGVTTTNVDNRVSVSDQVLVNRDGSTAVQDIDDLSKQLAGTGPLAEALLGARYFIRVATFAQLNAIAGSYAGQPADVTNDGVNTGSYSWSGSAWTLVGNLLDTSAIISQTALTHGEQLNYTSSLGSPSNGGTLISVSGRPVGISIPAGSTGASSSISPRMRLDPGEARRSVGKYFQIRTTMLVTVGYLAAKPFNGGNVVRVDNIDGSVTYSGTIVQEKQVGTTLYRDVLYGPITGNEDRIAPIHQVSSAAVSSLDAYSFQILSLTRQVVNIPSTLTTTAPDATLANLLANTTSGWGRIYGQLVPQNQNLNGAVPLASSDGRSLGYTIPSGQTGLSSNVRYRQPVPSDLRSLLPGVTINVTLAFTTSTTFTRTFTLGLTTLPEAGGTRAVTPTVIRNVAVSPTRWEYEFQWVATGDELELQYVFQLTSAAATASAETIILSDIEITTVVLNKVAGIRSRASENAAAFWEYLKASASALAITTVTGSSYAVSLSVAPSGGNYTTIAAAFAAASDAAAAKRYAIRLSENTFAERSLAPANYQDVIGAGINRSIIDGSQANDASLTDITNRSTFDMRQQSSLQGVSAIMRNGRYVIHDDGGNSGAYRNRTQRISDCRLVHEGNQGAIDYQTGIGGNPGGVWASPHAIGHGASSGSSLIIERSFLMAPRCALQMHSNLGFDDPASVLARDCELVATNNAGWVALVQPCGSGRQDHFTLEGCSGTGDIYYWPDPWMPTTLDRQPADHSEILVGGHGNSFRGVFLNAEFGRALKIESASTSATSTIAVSGSAVPVLFGSSVFSKPGAGGIKGYVYGWADIQEAIGVGVNRDVFITSLGKRLGDRTTSSVTLTVSVDGGSPVDITFNADYSAAGNATILDMINTALGAGAHASEYNVGGRYRPSFGDEEQTLSNIGSAGILMGMALAYDGSKRSVRPMTSADPLKLFAGVAWEDIYPNGWGRVKTSGWLPLTDLLRTDGGALSLDDAFTIDPAKPGYVISAAQPANGILPVVRPSFGAGLEAVRVGLV